MTKTEQVITEALQENTGTHFLDSGGAYGRNWERNQSRKFHEEPEGSLSFYDREDGDFDIDVTISLFHFLKDNLEYSPELQRKFEGFARRKDNEDEPWLALQERFPTEVLRDELGHEVGGIYGEGEPFTVNTYNGEDLLSQVIQYSYFEDEEYGECVLLSVHGGCDVRGGYAKPRAFTVENELAIFDNAKATIYCTGDYHKQGQLEGVGREEDHYWWTDDGYHWYREGACGAGAGKQLEDYEGSSHEEDKGNGKLYIDEDGNGYCPVCGAKLEVGPR